MTTSLNPAADPGATGLRQPNSMAEVIKAFYAARRRHTGGMREL
jgi:hypothetical protein